MLIKIAYCEDNLSDRKEIELLLYRWALQSENELKLQCFSDATKLIAAVDSSFEIFDIYLLDIEMRGAQEGMELAQIIRKQSEYVPIMFITSHRELVLKAFPVQALDFIVKPVRQEVLMSALNRAAERIRDRRTLFFACRIAGTLVRIPLYDIRFVQSTRNDLLINGDASQHFRGKLSDFVEKFPSSFLICHQSYAVNIEHIRSLGSTSLTLTSGKEIPISKSRLAQVRQRFASFCGLN